MVALRTWALALLLTAATGNAACAQGGAATNRVAGWSGDVDTWLNALRSQHYVFSRRPLPDSLVKAAARFRAGVAGWSDERALAELGRLAAMIGDGHTYVAPWGASRFTSHLLPVTFYAFTDGIFVVDADTGTAGVIGARVLSLANIPERQLLARVRPFVPRDNDEGVLWLGPFLLRFQGVLEALANRRLDVGIPLRLRLADGRDTSVLLAARPVTELHGPARLIPARGATAPAPLYLRDVRKLWWLQPLDDTTLYVQVNQIWDDSAVTLAAFSRQLKAELARQHTRHLIVDARHNNGGNLQLLDPLIAVLQGFTSGPQAGVLQIISGRNTFSAAQVFLARAEHEARARIVGEPSSSRPNFVGEENRVVLPWSGALTSISNQYHETIPGDTRRWIEPDPRIELSSARYFANDDPVLDALLQPHR